MTTDLEKAFTAISGKRSILSSYMAYVNGPQPLRYSTDRLKDAFENIKTHFEINWCSVVVDATNDRLGLSGFDVQDTKAQTWVSEQFERLQIHLESQQVHKAALGYTQGYLIVWPDANDKIEIYYNDPRLCEVFYDPVSPKKKQFAAKWYVVDSDTQEIILYYPDRLEHYIAIGKDTPSASRFKQTIVEPNPYGVIPVFEFHTDGEITRIVTLQDAINKMFSDMMVAGEFGAFVQRWVVSQADPSDLKNAPNEIWWIPAADAGGQASSVGQFTPTALTGYLDAMDRLANAIFIITRTPKHYIMSAGASISGEALLAMEAPFIKKVEWHKKRFDAYWKEVAQFILQLGGFALDVSDILITWTKSESTQPLAEAQTNQVLINTGIPLITVLRRTGWSESEIDALEDDIKKEKAARSSVAQSVLDSLRDQTAQDNPTGVNATPIVPTA